MTKFWVFFNVFIVLLCGFAKVEGYNIVPGEYQTERPGFGLPPMPSGMSYGQLFNKIGNLFSEINK